MASFMNWFIGVVQDGIIAITGGSIFLQSILGLLGFTMVLWRLQVSMPVALLVSFFALAVLSQTLDSPLNLIQASGTSGFNLVLFLVLVFMTGVLLWSLLVKKSQAGQG